MNRPLIIVAGALLVASGFILPSSAFSLNTLQASKAIPQQTAPTFVWFYGYVGGDFFPTTQLGITKAQVLHQASMLSDDIGKSNLRLVTAVDTTQAREANSTMIPVIKRYVDKLETYASVVYGRVDLEVFNMSSPTTVFQLVSEYVNQMDLNGVWFDHAVVYYSVIGRLPFDDMMQKLANEFPGLNFVLNNAAANHGIITPTKTDTWQANAYISPTVKKGTYNYVDLREVSRMNALYPGHVLVHFDASSYVMQEPMARFAAQNSSTEITTITMLASQGAHPQNQTEGYSLLYPFLGSWTYINSKYQGTIYNALAFGHYSRGTASSFISVMEQDS